MQLADAKNLKKGTKVTVVIPNCVRYHGSVACAGVNGKGEVTIMVSRVVTNTTGRTIATGCTRLVPLVDMFSNREIEFGFSLQNIQTVFETFDIQPAYA